MRDSRIAIAWALWLFLGGATAAHAGTPAAAAQVPDGVAFAVLVDRPGEAAEAFVGLLDRFKALNPEVSRERLSQEVVKELGDDVLTPAGMQAFGLDPNGGGALFGADLDGEPELLLPLSNPDTFVAKVIAAGQKNGQAFEALPKLVAGAKVLRSGTNHLAVGPRFAFLLSRSGDDAAAIKRVQAVLGPGKKLAGNKSFQKALAGMPPGAHAVLYLDFPRLGKEALADMDRTLGGEEKYIAGLPADQKKARQADLTRMRAVRKGFAALLAKFDAFAWSLQVGDRAIGSTMFLGALPAGQKLLQAAFPAGGPAAFHAGLAGRSLWSAWAAVRVAGFLELVADLPESPYRSMRDNFAAAERDSREELGVGVIKDLLNNLKEPLGFYLLTPDLSGLKAEEPMDQQVLRLFKVAAMARVGDTAKLDLFLDKIAEKLTAQGKTPEVSEAEGAKLWLLRPEPGVVIGLGRKGDAALFGFGEDAIQELARLVQPGGTSGAAQGNLRMGGRVDAAAISEVISSAVAKNIGGQDGMAFRMMWPMIQQVLGQVAGLDMEGSLLPSGLQARWSLTLR